MYIIQSQKDGKYYIGSTDDLTRRLIRHNKGFSKYTRFRGPFNLVFKEEFMTRSEAQKRGYYLKSLKSRKAIEKIINAAFV